MNIIYTALVGSHLHGTNVESSDKDYKSVYATSLDEKIFPLNKTTPTPNNDNDHVYYELSHFASLLLKNNPTVMEVAYATEFTSQDRGVVQVIASFALDTMIYYKQCSGFIHGLLHEKPTPKRLHHAARMATHLDIYLKTGILNYDARTYPNYDYLMELKRGKPIDVGFDTKKRDIDVRWHIQEKEAVQRWVCNYYKEHG